MAKRVAIVGTGQAYHKSHRPDVNGQELINEAVQRALADAELAIKDIDAILIGNMDHFEGINYVDCWSVDGAGGVMKPVIKITTGGTTGASLAIGGYHMVASGMFEKVLIIGWEKNSESDTTGAITTAFDPVWDQLFPKEKARILRLLVERVEYHAGEGRVEIEFRAGGIRAMAAKESQ